MDILGKMGEKVGTAFLSSMIVGSISKYAGDDCKHLRAAIALNLDIFDMWCKKYEEEGLYGPDQARRWAAMFPSGKNLLTVSNVRIWLNEQECSHIVQALNTIPGGDKWLAWTLDNFKKGLWD